MIVILIIMRMTIIAVVSLRTNRIYKSDIVCVKFKMPYFNFLNGGHFHNYEYVHHDT